MLDKKLNIIISGSFLLKSIFVFFFHEQNLSAEWAILFSNFQNFGSYSYYVFNNEGIPSSYMPPLYFLFLYVNKIISFDLINFLYLVFFNQILLSTISVYIFYKICNNFLSHNYSLVGALIFSIFPLLVYGNGLVSSATLQLFLYLLFFKIYLELFNAESKYKNLFFLTIICSFNLMLRGEFIVIFLFSIVYFIFLNKKNIIFAIILLLSSLTIISPYILRNYLNTNNFHIVNSSGYALWKGNNQIAGVEGFHDSLHPQSRSEWPEIKEFEKLYKKLDSIPKDKKYEIKRDDIFKYEAIQNILEDKIKYLKLYLKKILSLYFIDLNSSIKDYYNPIHILPVLLFAVLSIPGIVLSLKKLDNSKILYLILTTFLLTLFISLFFILPRYKISIISFQILFSLFFLERVFKKK